MRIFALETDIEQIKNRFCHEGETIVLMTYYHGLSFLFAILREIAITIILMTAAIVSLVYDFPMIWVLPVLLITWLIFVFFNVLKAYIDWTYDFLIITTDKVILVDQTSIVKQEIMPIHLENIGGISTFTQYMDIFPFGGICIHLKEGKGREDITLKYVPHSKEVSAKISDVVTTYQRRAQGNVLSTQPKVEQPFYSGSIKTPQQPEQSSQTPSQGSELGGGENSQ